MQRSAVGRSIISFRRGELSTWQCEQAWLQYKPTFSCSVVADSLLKGRTSCSWMQRSMLWYTVYFSICHTSDLQDCYAVVNAGA